MMKTSNAIWLLLLLVGGGFLVFRTATGSMGKAYVRHETFDATTHINKQIQKIDDEEQQELAKGKTLSEAKTDKRMKLSDRLPAVEGITWTKVSSAERGELTGSDGQPDTAVVFSWSRTIGLWIAALGTLAIMSFLWGDNIFYKVAESVVVGASAAYAMVVGFWTGIIQNLFGKLIPGLMRDSVLPGLPGGQEAELIYIVPLVLSVLMLWRLAPAGGWISRWPLAFFIGATAGIRLVAYLDADFVQQIGSTIMPLIVSDNQQGLMVGKSIGNIIIVIGVLTCLVYFFFSFEHKGLVGRTARVGIWFLMVTFGAGFGFTVMGRISLISDRFSFLFYDWLWIPKPGIDA
jgi:hypothetical protein